LSGRSQWRRFPIGCRRSPLFAGLAKIKVYGGRMNATQMAQIGAD
jgi:hypothetical protein